MADEAEPEMGEDNDAPEPEPTKPAGGDQDGEIRKLREQLRRETEYRKRNDARVKELEPLAAKARELEDASKTDLERLTGELDSHRGRADKAEGELLRLRVALRKGLTETQAKRLIGSSEDELEADADDLLASFSPKKDPEPDPEPEPEPSRTNRRDRPQERLRPGAVPDADTEPEETDPRKLAAMIPRHPTLG